MAMSSPHLLYAFLACACSHYGRLREDLSGDLAKSVTKFTNAALNGLRKAMSDPKKANRPETLTTALALCTSDVINGGMNSWRIHLSGASNLVTSVFALQGDADSLKTDDPTKLFLVKWFALLDIFAGVSGLHTSSNAEGSYWSLPTTNDAHGYIDEWTGYAWELIPIMSQIGRMAIVQRNAMQVISLDADADDIPDTGADPAEIQHLEDQIYALYDRTTNPDLERNPATKKMAEEMQHIHRAFLYTSLLHLYSRVQCLPKDHTKPAHAIHMVIEMLQKIPLDSMSNILTLWPVFTVGCETEDPVQRKIIRGRLAVMEPYGMGNVQSARKAMTEYWDSGATERWDIFLEKRGFDLTMF
ncbi:hypothetical protein N7462_004377 [Penicillium macrosclerotiorum]|uniref:uncharacterized protein n=1 Tax=Penicillium macrosclerotiorum TaxID=303699 RepID=UPI00254804E9|nr:uncharacterized protein N7462_004377 [Penicillium macrosclerotiorum]KAJ5689985.1 hypothetical protein N7462_004377 [Penicillium macrosclerotiorum]